MTCLDLALSNNPNLAQSNNLDLDLFTANRTVFAPKLDIFFVAPNRTEFFLYTVFLPITTTLAKNIEIFAKYDSLCPKYDWISQIRLYFPKYDLKCSFPKEEYSCLKYLKYNCIYQNQIVTNMIAFATSATKFAQKILYLPTILLFISLKYHCICPKWKCLWLYLLQIVM